MEGAVGGHGAEHLADRARCRARGRPARSRRRSAAAPMPRIIPWRRWSNGSAASSTPSSVAAAPEARKPAPIQSQQLVGGDVVGGDDHHAAAAAGADPVLGERDGLGGAGAGRVDLRVRPAGADELGELRVAHRQHAEQEAAVELVGVAARSSCLQVVDAPVELGERVAGSAASSSERDGLERLDLLLAAAVGRRSGSARRRTRRSRGRRTRRSRRCRRAASSGSIQRSGSWVSARGRLVVHARAGCRRRAARRCRRRSPAASSRPSACDPLGVDAELLGEVERRRRAPASLITSAVVSIVSKWPPPSSLLTSRVMCLSRISLADRATGSRR